MCNSKEHKSCECPDINSKEYQDYIQLDRVLRDAYDQAATGKGKERHANNKPFTKQPILEIARMVGDGFLLGQALKKAQETQRLLSFDAKIHELRGAINYLAAAIILYEEQRDAV